MKEVLFIGYYYHIKTGSCEFILKELTRYYKLTKVFIDIDKSNPYESIINLRNKHFDTLICWQIFPNVELINSSISFDKGIFFPMYDAVPSRRKIEKWWHIRNFQIICFSHKLHVELKRLGLSSRYIKYFPKPAQKLVFGDPNSAFFWYRHKSISYKDAEKICEKLKISHLHIHYANDPGHEAALNNDSNHLNITTSKWFKSKDELCATLSKSAYFIAPRNKEGIGMAFLEAMAQGKCVVAKDNSTMNEYIKHNENGILYKKKITNLGFDLKNIQRKAFYTITNGYQEWQTNKINIIKYINEHPKNNKIRLYFMILIGILSNPLKVLRTILKN